MRSLLLAVLLSQFAVSVYSLDFEKRAPAPGRIPSFYGVATFNNYGAQWSTVCGPKSGSTGTYAAAMSDIAPNFNLGRCTGSVDMSECLPGFRANPDYPAPQCPRKYCGCTYHVMNMGALSQSSSPGQVQGVGSKNIVVQIVDACPSTHPQNFCKTNIPTNQRCMDPTSNQLDIDQSAYLALTGVPFGDTPTLNISITPGTCPDGSVSPYNTAGIETFLTVGGGTTPVNGGGANSGGGVNGNNGNPVVQATPIVQATPAQGVDPGYGVIPGSENQNHTGEFENDLSNGPTNTNTFVAPIETGYGTANHGAGGAQETHSSSPTGSSTSTKPTSTSGGYGGSGSGGTSGLDSASDEKNAENGGDSIGTVSAPNASGTKSATTPSHGYGSGSGGQSQANGKGNDNNNESGGGSGSGSGGSGSTSNSTLMSPNAFGGGSSTEKRAPKVFRKLE